uniref:Uncharacterized protein n=1 Tax=Glossina pallidipes TaxID=7398 RepID=A0A1A9ZDU1_GLOPL
MFMAQDKNAKSKYHARNKINEYVISTSINSRYDNVCSEVECCGNNCGRNGEYAAECWGKRYEQHNDDNSETGLFATINEKILSPDSWFVDSYASSHTCCNRDWVEGSKEHKEAIAVAGDYKMVAKGHYTVRYEEV